MLPRAHVLEVLEPLLALGFDHVVEDVIAERGAHQVVLLEGVQRLAQVRRQLVDSQVAPLAVAHLEDVLVHRGARVDPLRNAIEPGPQHHRERQIGIAGGIGHAQFDAGALSSRGRHAHERAAVALAPGDVGRRLVPRHQALVGVDQRIGDRAHSLGVPQQAPDVVEARLAQLPWPLRVEERVLPLPEEGLVRVHARARNAGHRLGHERGVQAILQRHVLDHEPERAHVVGRRQRVVGTEVDLMLAGCHLVMGGLHLEAHALERDDDLAPHVLAEIHRGEIEVASRVVGLGGRFALPRLEQEEFGLGPRHHRDAACARLGDRPLERVAGAALEGASVRGVDVADDPGHLLARRVRPREDAERGEVRTQEHVRLLDAHETLD